MPTNKNFKRRVRDRMEKTGESYTAAFHRLKAEDSEKGERKPIVENDLSTFSELGMGPGAERK